MIADIKAELAAETGEPFIFVDGEPDIYPNNYTINIEIERLKS